MTAVDTDIFFIAALHPEDPRFAVNGRFVELMRSRRGAFATTIFNKLEMVGVCSFGMSRSQLQRCGTVLRSGSAWSSFSRQAS